MADGSTTTEGRILLPESVHRVLLDHQGTLWQVLALVRALVAKADRDEAHGECDISYGLEGVAALLQPICERIEPIAVAQDAAAQEVSHG